MASEGVEKETKLDKETEVSNLSLPKKLKSFLKVHFFFLKHLKPKALDLLLLLLLMFLFVVT